MSYEFVRPPIHARRLRTLENEKLVVRVPRKGTYVTNMSLDDCIQLFEMRKVIEVTAIQNIFKNENLDATIKGMERALAKASNQFSSEISNNADLLEQFRVLGEFHFAIVNSSGNDWLIHLNNTISSCLSRYQFLYLRLEGSMNLSITDHTEIVNNFYEGDLAKVIYSATSHVDHVVYRVKKQMIQDVKCNPTALPHEKNLSFQTNEFNPA